MYKKTMVLLAVSVFVFSLTFQVSGAVAHGFSGTQTFSNVGSGGLEPGEPLPCGISTTHTDWFAYTAEADGSLTVDTIGSNFDTVLAVYTGPGSSYTSLVSVACSDDFGGVTQSSVTFSSVEGTIYWIQVAGKGSASGTVILNTDLIPTLIVGSTNQIVSAQSWMTITNVAEPKPCNISCKYTRWVRLDVAAAGTLTVDTIGSNFDTVLALYSGSAALDYGALTALNCNDNLPSSVRSRTSASVGAGTYVWAQVGGKGTVRGTIKLNYNLAP